MMSCPIAAAIECFQMRTAGGTISAMEIIAIGALVCNPCSGNFSTSKGPTLFVIDGICGTRALDALIASGSTSYVHVSLMVTCFPSFQSLASVRYRAIFGMPIPAKPSLKRRRVEMIGVGSLGILLVVDLDLVLGLKAIGMRTMIK